LSLLLFPLFVISPARLCRLYVLALTLFGTAADHARKLIDDGERREDVPALLNLD
jgi:hypothetical protein